MVRDVIPSLAILKVNWDEHRNYIDNFVPFIAECIRTAPEPEISTSALQSAVKDGFGFDIPQGALNTILRRCEKYGYVTRAQGFYRRNDEAVANLGLARDRDDALRKYEALVDKLVAFCSSRFELSWSGEEAEAALLHHLEECSAVILATAVKAQPLRMPPVTGRGADYVVASFVAHVERADSEAFGFLETVVKGSMLAGVLLFPDLGGVEERFEEVRVFFDTAFVLQALGLEGASRQAPRTELIKLLYEKNANLRVFAHTLDEVRSVLSAVAHALRNYANLRLAHGPVVQHFIDAGYAASDVELIIARLEKSLRALRIYVEDKPPHVDPLTVDEIKLEALLQDVVGYWRKEALYHDLDSLTAIYRLRGGSTFLHVESSKAVFITTNHDLFRASRQFFSEQRGGYDGSAVPICLLDHIFTTIVWLKRPLAAEDLPRKRLIAECYAAMNPPDVLWRKYLDEIDRLGERGDISSEDYDLLRLSAPAREALMDLTLGEADVFTEGTVQEILERAKAAARAETEVELQAEREARVEAGRIAEMRVGEAVAEAEQARASLDALREAQVDRIRTLAAVVGRWAATLLNCIGLVFLATMTFLGVYFFLSGAPGGLLLPLGAAASVLLAVATVANMAFGATLLSLTRRVEVAVSKRIERALIALFGLHG